MGKTQFILSLMVALVVVANFEVSLTLCTNNITTDQLALAAVKSHLLNFNTTDHHHLLAANWSIAASVCNWVGVTCAGSRVTALHLPNMSLSGALPPQLGNLSFLTTLNLENNSFHGSLPLELAQLRRLKHLSLSNNRLSGEIPSWLGSSTLSNLQNLSLYGNNFVGVLPISLFSNNSKLELLDLHNNSLRGRIPEAIGNPSSSRLRWLYLDYNYLSGSIPSSLFNMPNSLQEIFLGHNQLSGPIPLLNNITMPSSYSSSIEIIGLTSNNLTGHIPSGMFHGLPKLRKLYLKRNGLSGPIPTTLFKYCPKLQVVSLGYNSLEGTIPKEIGNLTVLKALYLGDNNLKGEIPQQIGTLLSLEVLSLLNNNLIGSIPSAIANLSHLTTIRLGHNNLAGEIPYQIGDLKMLDVLSLGDNHITGSIPPSIFNISSLSVISLYDNRLSGNLPSTIGLWLPKLKTLLLALNNLMGPIPTSICNASRLTTLDLGSNSFSGDIPDQLGNLVSLRWINLEYNNLSSTHQLTFLSSLANCKDLRFSAFGENPLITGQLPISIGNLSVHVFQVNDCNVRGSIPREIGNLSNLIHLDIGNNQLIGPIPTTIGRLRKLQMLTLRDNKLEGSIPSELCQLKSLGFLYLSANNLVGSIPSCLGDVISIRELFIGFNKINGSIPPSLANLVDILKVNLSSNSISGALPIWIEKWKVVTSIDLSQNQLSGKIPSTIGGLVDLTHLSLSGNRLEGSIPESFGGLIGLQFLDLSRNNLSGVVPKSLDKLSLLGYFNVSFNRLEGEIYGRGPYDNYSMGSFKGNEALCAAPWLQLPLPRCKTRQHSRKALELAKYILLPAVGLTLLVLALILSFIQRRKRNGAKRTTCKEIDSQALAEWRRVSYHELRQATNGFSESKLIGVGSVGSVYKGTLSDGLSIAVKVFNLNLEGAFKSFDIECEVLCNVRHRNLVKIISSCSNDLDFKALVLEFMPNGSLERCLYFDNHFFDILQRLNTMIDVASALEYLHHGCTTPVVHCDLKPSNVLLDKDMVAHLGDFGIAKLIGDEDSTIHTMTLATIGYMAPEYGAGGSVSTKGDVYSFGILLMETFTRKKPIDEMFYEEMSLKDWVAKSIPSTLLEVVDANLLENNREEEHNARKDCACSVLQLALECSKEFPDERMNMKQVVVTLKNVKLKFLKALNGQADEEIILFSEREI